MKPALPKYLLAALLVAFTTQGFAQFSGGGGGMGGMGGMGGGRNRSRGAEPPAERATVIPADLDPRAASAGRPATRRRLSLKPEAPPPRPSATRRPICNRAAPARHSAFRHPS